MPADQFLIRRKPSQSQMHCETSELQNSLERHQKFPEIFGNLTSLAQKKLAGIPVLYCTVH